MEWVGTVRSREVLWILALELSEPFWLILFVSWKMPSTTWFGACAILPEPLCILNHCRITAKLSHLFLVIQVKFSVIVAYARSMGILCALIILLSGFGAESSAIASRIWLAKWSSTNVSTSKQRDTFLGFYALMGVGQVVLVTAMNLTLAYSALKASGRLHQGILINVMHLPMQFFESSPLGRIMNRFSKDVNSVDERIPRSLVMFLRTFLASLGTVFVISYSTPLFLTCVLPLGALYVFIQVRLSVLVYHFFVK